MSNLGLIAKANNKTVKYCDAIDAFIRKSGEISFNRRLDSSNVLSGSGNHNGLHPNMRGRRNVRNNAPDCSHNASNLENSRHANSGNSWCDDYLP
jgi:hypothetical protein